MSGPALGKTWIGRIAMDAERVLHGTGDLGVCDTHILRGRAAVGCQTMDGGRIGLRWVRRAADAVIRWCEEAPIGRERTTGKALNA
jgi:hypothetical protein